MEKAFKKTFNVHSVLSISNGLLLNMWNKNTVLTDYCCMCGVLLKTGNRNTINA